MLGYLQEWLKMRAGAAPVWATLIGEDRGSEYNMLAVDEFGVVLALKSMGRNGTAYPWSSILSVPPHREQ